MQQLLAVWQALTPQRRIVVAAATISVFAAAIAISLMAAKPSMSLLYAGIEGPKSGEIIAALEQRGAAYEVRGESIYVEAPRRDELRMTLAAEGLPAMAGAGYELLDSISGFGTTSQMFDAAYWRAKEGELARTIVSSPAIRSARVHIATPAAGAFRQTQRPTASVTVASAAGGLSASQAKALKYLVAAAVTGMTPDDVSIIDNQAGLISSGEELPNQGDASDRAAELKRNVERLLEARVGRGNAVVEISVETLNEQEAITERVFDPSGRVAISTDTENRSQKSDDTQPDAVTVASNLPANDAGAGGKSQSQSTETRERTNFEVSETRREVQRLPGAIRRLTVAVLIDGVQNTGADGQSTWEPRPEEELSALRELVASAVGFDEARGDVITLRSMQFEPVAVAGTEAAGGLLSSMAIDLTQIIQFALLALVALVLGLFVMRPILTQAAQPAFTELPPPEPGPGDALTGEIAEGEMGEPDIPDVSGFDLGALNMPMAMGSYGESSEDPVERLRKLIGERQAETVEILRSWMDEKERG